MLKPAIIMLFATALPCGALEVKTEVKIEVKLIANPSCASTSVSAEDLSDLYLGKKSKWSDGAKAVVFTNADADETETFLSKYLDRTAASFSAAWKRLVFTGKASPPAEAKDDQEMIEKVKKTPGAVGYVKADTKVEGVITLTVTR